ncbi:hypothetical protein QE152_g37042 [Popillia japonica]|uniref:Uncharacterized protein n=1 Tax=Popillia japonica TaxID=7064 RepID=A0AAW1IBK7_POPJA
MLLESSDFLEILKKKKLNPPPNAIENLDYSFAPDLSRHISGHQMPSEPTLTPPRRHWMGVSPSWHNREAAGPPQVRKRWGGCRKAIGRSVEPDAPTANPVRALSLTQTVRSNAYHLPTTIVCLSSLSGTEVTVFTPADDTLKHNARTPVLYTYTYTIREKDPKGLESGLIFFGENRKRIFRPALVHVRFRAFPATMDSVTTAFTFNSRRDASDDGRREIV